MTQGTFVSQSNEGNTMTDNGKTSLHATQFKTIDRMKIRFATNDKTDGDPILLLSPLPESILAFLPTWEMFSALGPLVAVDLPAFGLSESQPHVRAPEPMGDFVIRIIEAFGLAKPHVVAPDVGTPACLFAAAKSPRRLQEPGDRKRRDGSHRHRRHLGPDRQCPFSRTVQRHDRRTVRSRRSRKHEEVQAP